jgi:NAD(P)-dependent dehydrogenase (short-subunit alcohol dehydrogenase family)
MPERAPFIDFGGRWVVVSGASSGIGRAACTALAVNGARVVLMGRDESRLADTAATLEGAEHQVLPLDLKQHEAIAPAITQLRQRIGPIYGFCHAAGVVETRPLSASSVELIQGQLDINVLAGLELARVICRRDIMTPDGGSVLFISSVYGRVGMPGQIGYCATKGAIASATRAMAIELARRNIRVNCLSPGLVNTEMTKRSLGALSAEHGDRLKAQHPLGPGEPEDVARAIVFMLSPGSRWITGADLAVDGGFTAQ